MVRAICGGLKFMKSHKSPSLPILPVKSMDFAELRHRSVHRWATVGWVPCHLSVSGDAVALVHFRPSQRCWKGGEVDGHLGPENPEDPEDPQLKRHGHCIDLFCFLGRRDICKSSLSCFFTEKRWFLNVSNHQILGVSFTFSREPIPEHWEWRRN